MSFEKSDEIELTDGDADVLAAIRPHFQPEYYLERNPDVARAGIDPLVHYTLYGWRELRDPNPDFSTEFYLLDNTDVAESGVHPFWHFVVAGMSEGRMARSPKRSGGRAPQRLPENAEALRLIEPFFDAAFYLSENPDVAEANVDPLEHYYLYGWKENRDPAPDFSTLAYLNDNHDVYQSKVNPFWHYHVAGKGEGRSAPASGARAEPSEKASAGASKNPAQAPKPAEKGPSADRIAQEVAAIRDAFDSGYYLRHNPDVAAAGIDPVEHFVVSGWKEGRDPNSGFSVAYYLEANPDVRDLNLNPFWHYIIAGKVEGRLARHPGGYRAETLIHTRPLEDTVGAWRGGRKRPETLLTGNELRAALQTSLGGKTPGLMISIGHDNYRDIPGGVQFCLQHEEETATSRGMLYLNLYPHQPLPRLSHTDEDPEMLVGLLLGGKPLGAASMATVITTVKGLVPELHQVEVVVHHLMGHQPELVTDLVHAAGKTDCWMWLHDFFTLCPSYALQRNNVSFCGAPKINSNSCALCLYGSERGEHGERMARFFETVNVHCIAPSRFTADYWTARSGISPASLSVCEHMWIEWDYSRAARTMEKARPITIAFVGYPAPHKGWPMFERLVRENRGEHSEFRFVYFGTSEIVLDHVDRIPVSVSAEDPNAMISALSEQNVDFVLHWATCAETFSFSTHEALASGAYVLTNPISGNVAVTVRRSGLGLVLDTEAALEAFFRDGHIHTVASEVRSRRHRSVAQLTRSDMTFAILDKEVQP